MRDDYRTRRAMRFTRRPNPQEGMSCGSSTLYTHTHTAVPLTKTMQQERTRRQIHPLFERRGKFLGFHMVLRSCEAVCLSRTTCGNMRRADRLLMTKRCLGGETASPFFFLFPHLVEVMDARRPDQICRRRTRHSAATTVTRWTSSLCLYFVCVVSFVFRKVPCRTNKIAKINSQNRRVV